MLYSLLVFLSFTCIFAHADSIYDGHKLYDVNPISRDQAAVLAELLSQPHEDYDFLSTSKIPGQSSRIIISARVETTFLALLQRYNITYALLHSDINAALQQDFEQQRFLRSLKPVVGKGRLSTDRYYTYDEILHYVDDLGRRFPSRVFVKTVGKSYENRPLKTVKVTNGDGRPNKNIIFMDGGFHAREWISHAAVLYVLEQLVENFEANSNLLKDYDWVILPVVNPDGYEYSQLSGNRLWRKTRKPYESQGRTCWGADPNRNFDFHWNEEGASSNPCADTFAGPTPFSEPETQVVRDIMLTLRGSGKMYLTIHSYGNYLLYPWGWTSELPETWQDLDEVARAGGDAILNATGTKYTVGSSTNVLYIAAGASDDYAFHVGFPISITMELPRGGIFGFNPPPTDIDRLVKETWIGIRAMGEKMIEKYPTEYKDFL